jgi:hypothetical protein
VLKASGEGIREYLQGQITQDMAKLNAEQSIYACILTPQGKAVSVVYILEGHNRELILLTPRDLAVETVARLHRFALGADLRIGVVENMGVCSIQGANASEGLALFGLPEPGQSGLATVRHADSDVLAMLMPRDPRGFWLVAPQEQIEDALSQAKAVVDEDEIEAMRIIQGLPRLGVDWQATLHPLNANLAEFDGVSFDKGCYVGQEVTSRMHWRGGISKKLYKVMIDGSPAGCDDLPCPLLLTPDSENTKTGAPKIGELSSAALDHEGRLHGIALLPIETAESGKQLYLQTGAKVFIGEACHA